MRLSFLTGSFFTVFDVAAGSEAALTCPPNPQEEGPAVPTDSSAVLSTEAEVRVPRASELGGTGVEEAGVGAE